MHPHEHNGDPDDESSSSEKFNAEFQGTASEFRELLNQVMRQFGSSLQSYLLQRGATRSEAEDAVQDFVVKQMEKRSIHGRLHYWIHVKQTPERVTSFLKACVLHQFIDQRRKRSRTEPTVFPLGDSASKQLDRGREKLDPLDYTWAVSLLQVALLDFKYSQIGDPAANQGAATPGTNGLLNWQIFEEQFASSSTRRPKLTIAEIGEKLRLSRDQAVYRIQQVRELFASHLRQAIIDSCPDSDSESLFQELKCALIVGGVSLPSLLAESQGALAESTLETFNVFSLASFESTPNDEVIDLLTPTASNPDARDELELWNLLMRREYFSSSSSKDSPHATNIKSVEELIFAERPSLDDLQMLKQLARIKSQTEHGLLRTIYHVLYVLTIARGKNVYDQTITSLSPKQRVHSINTAIRYEWLPTEVSRELELAVRAFTKSDT
ncbi:MAG: hypothetical protein JNL67_07430 [Planctomycetaceae bacterium]|nr:hypothetical protein [Planctomycetaceae bacterium]